MPGATGEGVAAGLCLASVREYRFGDERRPSVMQERRLARESPQLARQPLVGWDALFFQNLVIQERAHLVPLEVREHRD